MWCDHHMAITKYISKILSSKLTGKRNFVFWTPLCLYHPFGNEKKIQEREGYKTNLESSLGTELKSKKRTSTLVQQENTQALRPYKTNSITSLLCDVGQLISLL